MVTVQSMLDRVDKWADYLSMGESDSDLNVIRQHAGTGRPVGRKEFIESLEILTGKSLKKGKPGPKQVD